MHLCCTSTPSFNPLHLPPPVLSTLLVVRHVGFPIVHAVDAYRFLMVDSVNIQSRKRTSNCRCGCITCLIQTQYLGKFFANLSRKLCPFTVSIANLRRTNQFQVIKHPQTTAKIQQYVNQGTMQWMQMPLQLGHLANAVNMQSHQYCLTSTTV